MCIKKLMIVLLFLVYYNAFAQQNLPNVIIGRLPPANSTDLYRIQVGAFLVESNAEEAILKLRKNALNPVSEKSGDFTRVMIQGIPANQVLNFLAVLKQAGFDEVIIRIDTNNSNPQVVRVRDRITQIEEVVVINPVIEAMIEHIENLSDDEFFSFLLFMSEFPDATYEDFLNYEPIPQILLWDDVEHRYVE